MRNIEFDSFGEPIPQGNLSNLEPQSGMSLWALRAGTAIFWSFIVVTLAARIAYFDPDLATKFDQLAASSRSVLAMLGV